MTMLGTLIVGFIMGVCLSRLATWLQERWRHRRWVLEKVAGKHWVMHYPAGTTRIHGVEIDNAAIAQTIVRRVSKDEAEVEGRIDNG